MTGMRATRLAVVEACQTLDGLGGASGPTVVTSEMRDLARRTEEVAALGGEIDENLVKDYEARASSWINLILGLFFGAAFAIGNGALLSQFFRGFVTAFVMGIPLAIPMAVMVVLAEVGLGWLLAWFSKPREGQTALRHLPVAVLLLAIGMIAFIEAVIFGLLSYNFELEGQLFIDHAWLRYWMAPFGLVFVTATSATGFALHQSLDDLAESRGAARLRNEIRTANRFVQELPDRWARIGAKARQAEASMDAYFAALGGREGALTGSIDRIKHERDGFEAAIAAAQVGDWQKAAIGSGGDTRREAASNVGLAIATVVSLAAYSWALKWLLSSAFERLVQLPDLVWTAIAMFATLAIYAVGQLPFQRLQYMEGNKGRVQPLVPGAVELGAAAGIMVLVAIGIFWSGYFALGPRGLLLALVYLGGAGGLVLLGYSMEGAIRGATLVASETISFVAGVLAGALALLVNTVAWIIYIAVGVVVWLARIVGAPVSLLLWLFSRPWQRDQQAAPTPTVAVTPPPQVPALAPPTESPAPPAGTAAAEASAT